MEGLICFLWCTGTNLTDLLQPGAEETLRFAPGLSTVKGLLLGTAAAKELLRSHDCMLGFAF